MGVAAAEVDQAALTEKFGEDAVADVQEAIRTGVDGWVTVSSPSPTLVDPIDRPAKYSQR